MSPFAAVRCVFAVCCSLGEAAASCFPYMCFFSFARLAFRSWPRILLCVLVFVVRVWGDGDAREKEYIGVVVVGNTAQNSARPKHKKKKKENPYNDVRRRHKF